jgi:hypothetical protein
MFIIALETPNDLFCSLLQFVFPLFYIVEINLVNVDQLQFFFVILLIHYSILNSIQVNFYSHFKPFFPILIYFFVNVFKIDLIL